MATPTGGHNLVVVQADEQSPVPVQHRPRVPATGQGLHSPRGHCEAIMEDCLLCILILMLNQINKFYIFLILSIAMSKQS